VTAWLLEWWTMWLTNVAVHGPGIVFTFII